MNDLNHPIIKLIRNEVHHVAPSAKIMLFGSRARGTAREDSDWDFLILIDAPRLTSEHRDIDYNVWSKALEMGQEVNCVIRTNRQWDDNISMFKHNVMKEGIAI